MDINKIYNMDCIRGMKEVMDRDSVDVIVTSPPYNIGIDYNKYDDDRSFDDYLDWMGIFAECCKRVLRDDGSLFLNIGDKPSDEFRSFRVAEMFCDYFTLQNKVHWVKHIVAPSENVNIGHYKPVNSVRYLNNCHEYIFHFTSEGDVDLNKLDVGVEYGDSSNVDRWGDEDSDKRGRGNTWFIPYGTVHDKKAHPAAFPILLPERCIRLHGYDNNTVVFDPFMGSGTTALASLKLDCKYIGFEIDEDYIETARDRIEGRVFEDGIVEGETYVKNVDPGDALDNIG